VEAAEASPTTETDPASAAAAADRDPGNPGDPALEAAAAGSGGPGGPELPVLASPGRPWVAFLPRLVVWVALLAFITLADPDPALSLMLVALAGIVTIISDDRFAFERRLDEAGIPSREAWVPLTMLGVLLLLDLVQTESIGDVLGDDGPVIAFILAFSVVAEGLRRSGFIHFLAYRLTDRGGSNTTRLMLYLFLLSSLLAYFTSNDIVILTMTPIVVSVAYQSRIENAKVLLLSQFVAANTVSMGLLIGSPSNLIVGRALGLKFFEYMFLMLAPALMALMGTFVLVTLINRFVQHRARGGGRLVGWLFGTWAFSPGYRAPRFSEFRSFTPDMRRWVIVFGGSVATLAIGTSSHTGLLIATVAIAVVGTVSLYRSSRENDEPNGTSFAGKTIRSLPLGIIFFGLTYFVIADAIASTPYVQGEVDEFVSEQASGHTPLVSWSSTLAAGGLVNTMNDLPAGALAGKVLERAEFATPFDQALVTQSTLVGLNIATYVTPVGALAGIIWFDILRRERRRRHAAALASGIPDPFDVVMPRRRDLIVYGSITFIVMTLVLGATNFGFVSLADMLLGPPDGGGAFGAAPSHLAWMLACLVLIIAVIISFRRVLARAGVALAHLSDVLVVLTSMRLWAARHRVAAAATLAALLFIGTGATLYWAESFHVREYERPAQFDDPGEFVTWLLVFVSSGFENDEFPYSVIGHVLAAVLALGSIATLVVLVRLSTGSNDLTLRRKLGQGEIPTDRLVLVNCTVEHRGLVRTLVAESSRFVTIATRDPLLEGRLGLRGRDRVAVIPYDEPTSDLVSSLRLEEASELVLLSRSVTDDFDNLALLSALDVVASGRASERLIAGVGDDGRRTMPVVVLELHESGLPALVDHRLSNELRASVARPSFETVVRSFLVADTSGRLDLLQGLYADPVVLPMLASSDPAIDRRIRINGLDVALVVGNPLPTASSGPGSSASALEEDDFDRPLDAIGLQVDMAGRPVWRRFSSWRADEVPRQITGIVRRIQATVGASAPVGSSSSAASSSSGSPSSEDDSGAAGEPAKADRMADVVRAEDTDEPAGDLPAAARAGDGTVRDMVFVVGGTGFAQRCALDLAAGGVPDVRLLVGADEPLLPTVGETDNVTVEICKSELEAADVLARRASGDSAILVIDRTSDRGLDSEKLLERLSIARLHDAAAGRTIPPLYVCCRGPERTQRLRNFVIDKVIDATWVESSYFATFAAVYFDVVLQDEDLANWPPERQLAVADRVASRLCHLDIGRPGDPRLAEVGAAAGVVSRAGTLAPSVPGSGSTAGGGGVLNSGGGVLASGDDAVIGSVRFSIDRDEDQASVVVVDLVPPEADRAAARRDLVAALRYL
jgi:arsenical pump membrane protein